MAEDGETVLATETKELTTDKALGHDYKAVFTWAEDNKSATAEITCSRCDLKETKDAAVGRVQGRHLHQGRHCDLHRHCHH